MKKTILASLLMLIVSFFFVTPYLTPSFSEINPDDEAKYIESGWRLLHDGPRDLAWGPLVALVYAPMHLVVGNSPDWFMIEAWGGRIVLFALLWLSMLHLALQFETYTSPLVMAGALFILPVCFPILENQSDALFVSLAAFGLARFIAYSRQHRLKDLSLASLCVGLGVLARVETILLIGILVMLGLVFRRHTVVKILAAGMLPTLSVLLLFFVLSLATTGGLNLGVNYKSYDSFEMNQPVPAGSSVEEARQATRRLFGTQEENQGSVLRAILRNPLAFGARILAHAQAVPSLYLTFFGKRLAPILSFFAIWGLYALIRRREMPLLMIPLAWSLPAAIALGFFSRHVIPQTMYVPLLFGSIGIASAFDGERRREENIFLGIASALLMAYSWVDHKPAFFYGFLLLAVVFGLVQLGWHDLRAQGKLQPVGLLLLLAVGLILRPSYSFDGLPAIGQSIDERAIHYLQAELPGHTAVLSTFALPAIASQMTPISVTSVPPEIETTQGLWDWSKREKIRAIYLDRRYAANPEIVQLADLGLGEYFTLGFTSDDNTIRIYEIVP